ncbi:MAG: hypothetical protein IJ736_00130 [Firmicutes bacterium]|nr:hypothetical protein [Bacillota bacterium]
MKRNKFLPCIDNVYYTCFLKNDWNDNKKIEPLIVELGEQRKIVQVKHENIDFFHGLQLTPYGFNVYKYCLSEPELFDIFIIDYLPNIDTPRVLVQLRAYGLWVYGVEQMIIQSFEKVQDLFMDFVDDVDYFSEIDKCRENRIDYCFHTNAIKNPYKEFSDSKLEGHLKTIFDNYGIVGHVEKSNEADKQVKLIKDYVSFGRRSANNVFVRIYNKGLEVCQLAYKSFFFEVWKHQGLINAFDKYCYEYAYEKKDYDFIHKARLQFYIHYGTDPKVKKEFQAELDKDLPPLDYKVIADKYLPEVTTVINVEFETKRRFYYYSDDFIDSHLKTKTEAPHQLRRIFKIIDNRGLFLDYLTSKTLSFVGTNGEYCDWWQRLRTTKLDTIKNNDKLLRNYSKELDRNIVLKRAVNAVATSALYSGLENFDLAADVTDLMSNINDNTIQSYRKNKAAKKQRLKNLLK